jgi:hypothetical protein
MNPTRRLSVRRPRSSCTSLMRQAMVLGLLGISAVAGAADMVALDDSVLSQVQGRDGVNFAVNLNTAIGSNIFSVDNALGLPTSISHSNVLVTGLYAVSIDIMAGAAGAPDFLNWIYPDITSTKPLNMVYDMAITADGNTFGSSVTLQDFLMAGSSMQLSSSDQGGMAFGMAQKLQHCQRVDAAQRAWQHRRTTVHVGRVHRLGAESGPGPWVIADLVNQPGQFNIMC